MGNYTAVIMKNFDEVIQYVLEDEGGYVDHPSDPGGATNMGITRRTLADWRGVVPYTKLDKSEVKNLTKAEAKAIYKARYWDVIKGDLLPSGIDYAVFDFALHSGPAKAVNTLQRLVGVEVDGLLGNKTLAAVAQRGDLMTLLVSYQDARMKFLQGLSAFGVFGKGWMNRVQKVTLRAKKLLKILQPEQDRQDNQEEDNTVEHNGKPNWVRIAVAILGGIITLFKFFNRSRR